MRNLTPIAFISVALLAGGCATELPTYPSDLEYQYAPIERGAPPPTDRAMPIIPGSHPSSGPVMKEQVAKPQTNAQAMRVALRESKTNPVDCDFENSIMVCPFEKGRIYNVFVKAANIHSPSMSKDGGVINAKAMDGEEALVPGYAVDTPGNPTLFMLEPGESVVNIGFDDYTWFMLPEEGGQESGVDMTSIYGGGPGKQAVIPLRGWKYGECTGMWILTDRRTYLLNVCTNRHDYNRAVAWHYPQKLELADNVFAAGGGSNGGEIGGISGIDPARLKRYDISGTDEWLPAKWEAWHDGEKLHLIPPAELASRPVPFVRRDGHEGKSRWDVGQDGNYVIYGRPKEVFMHEGDPTRQIVFTERG